MGAIKNIWYLLQTANITCATFAGLVMITIIILTIVHKKCVDNKKKMNIWRICALMPVVILGIHFAKYCVAGKCTSIIFTNYTMMYLPVVGCMVWILFANKKKLYKFTSVILNIIAVFSFIYPTLTTVEISNFVNMSYTDSFKSLVNIFEDQYLLSNWKKIDYEKIENEIYPLIKEAEENNDEVAYAEALMKFVYKFYDGHVDIAFDAELQNEIYEKVLGNDYGFSMVTLENGKTIAILVEKESKAQEAGIIDGSEIKKWNGLDIDVAKGNVECYAYGGIPVQDNEEFLKPLYLAGMGNEKIEVTFINMKGEEITVELNAKGSYKKRLDLAFERLFKTKENTENFYTAMLTKECGYLKINREIYNLYDEIAYLTDNHFLLKNMLVEKLDKMKSEGMKNLVIDLRNNGGGMEIISREVAALFADKDYFASATGYIKDNEYIKIDDQYINATRKYKDINVAVLVNMKCISSGDLMASFLMKLPNVTTMGITNPNGSAQELGGLVFVSEGIGAITYPTGLTLDENNEPSIDTSAEKISRNAVDEKIFLTQEAAIDIFVKNEDYELDYAIDFLENKKN